MSALNPSPEASDVLIIGAGLAGLTAARALSRAGLSVTLLEKSPGLGGRLATRRVDTPGGTAFVDHGAQYFTAHSPAFQAQVADWRAAGLLRVWFEGRLTPAGLVPDGQPRYVCPQGMTALAKALWADCADGVTLHRQTRAAQVIANGSRWQVTAEDGRTWSARALVVTAPVPQALELLAPLRPQPADPASAAWRQADAIRYQPCLGLLATLAEPSAIPAPGAVTLTDGPVSFIADNQQKGTAPAPSVTVHASGDWSAAHWDASDEAVANALKAAIAPWVPAIAKAQVKRWRYALASVSAQEPPYLALNAAPPLWLAGDGYGGPRVEGAYQSGAAVAGAVEATLYLKS